MNRMQSFEQSWAARHGVPVESMAQYRFESREGYRLPDMAAHYRTYCDALDSVVVDFSPCNIQHASFNHVDCYSVSDVEVILRRSGLRISK